MEIKPLDQNAQRFDANGRAYVFRSSLDVKQFAIFEELQLEFQSGVNAATFYKNVEDAYLDFNAMKFADGCSKLYNALHGAGRIVENRPHPALLILTLFCQPEDFDGAWDEDLAAAWIDDWSEERIAVNSLFTKAFDAARRFIAGLQFNFRDTSGSDQPE
jgi:hypothetical protein